MISFEEARQIAAERLAKRLKDISGCTEFTTAWSFYNPRTADSIGGPDSSVVVLKESGKSCGFTEFILNYGGGKIIREITF